MRGERIKVKGACFQDDLARLGRKNCWQFRSREEGGIVFDRNHVLHRDSSFGVPELLSPARSIRGEENRHRGEGGFSFVPGSPLAGSDDSNRNGRKRSNQRVPRFAGMRIYIYIYSFRFPSLFHSRFRFFAFFVRKERSCRIEPISFAFLTFSKFILPSFRFLFRPFSSRCENVKY